MKKRSKYRPKPVLLNPIGFVLEGMERLSSHSSSLLLTIKLKNHNAMATITQGKGTRAEIDLLINMINVCEALYRLGFGEEYGDILKDGTAALLALAKRGKETGKFILWAAELKALNDVMELHDAQMEVITVRDMEKAVLLVKAEALKGKMTKI